VKIDRKNVEIFIRKFCAVINDHIDDNHISNINEIKIVVEVEGFGPIILECHFINKKKGRGGGTVPGGFSIN